MLQGMAYWIHAKIKDSDSAFSVVVGTAKDALAKLAELAELDQVEVAAMDLSGTIIELVTLQAEANRAP
jgi:nitrate reductase NapAB chaperone NapD